MLGVSEEKLEQKPHSLAEAMGEGYGASIQSTLEKNSCGILSVCARAYQTFMGEGVLCWTPNGITLLRQPNTL